ncbi:DUF1015 family protein [Streptomyces marispadix]|uniref:DUF1015 domain-containing protein n=1 Tax=Streptomyces marispadix TaxID=2922868 RepID=A0ABS9STC8_9ACTN|nr:DUF1015 domain-containing protein [Streptomyces marispadix]MCH6159534.1 DUF1015 domain-containing protein [Streptomyces marispadix]
MTHDGLRLKPFRGLRYAPGKVGSLSAVTSPPYDVVVRPDELRDLETSDPYNIVRLILPQAAGAAERQAKAAATLRTWRAEGVLEQDPRPALYVYEQRRGGLLQRGIIGALRLSPPEEGVVLPHEDVMDDVVEDRAALMRATGANLEPLLLSYRGDGTVTGAAAVVERAVGRTPLLSTTTEDGFCHKLWPVTDSAELAEIDADLGGRDALIADGHHRWATYLRLRAEHRDARAREDEHGNAAGSLPDGRTESANRADAEATAPDGGPDPASSSDPPEPYDPSGRDSPWDYGLVLLVDTVRHPLLVQAIHRVLPRLPLQRALDAVESEAAFDVRAVETRSLPQALQILDDAPGNAFLLTDGTGAFHLLQARSSGLSAQSPDTEHPDAGRPYAEHPYSERPYAGQPAAWRHLDAAVLHSVLLDEVWRVPDRPEDISYIHDATAAAGKAAQTGGTAVLMRPVSEETVRELAEQGVMMPRKSTSFGPKPATGLVLRTLEDNA